MNMGWIYSLKPQSPHFTMGYQLVVTQISSKIPTKAWCMGSRNMVGTHPYAHPQHIKVVKHLMYI